jgi:hypothetical protein
MPITQPFTTFVVAGSHQNVLTMRLVEELSLTARYLKILDLNDFPG